MWNNGNVQSLKPGWDGNLVLEFSNNTSNSKIYANEGAAQILFFKGE